MSYKYLKNILKGTKSCQSYSSQNPLFGFFFDFSDFFRVFYFWDFSPFKKGVIDYAFVFYNISAFLISPSQRVNMRIWVFLLVVGNLILDIFKMSKIHILTGL